MKEFTFIWSIENISYSSCKTGEEIVSPTFFAGPIQNSAWTLRLYPRGIDNSDYLSLFLRRENDNFPAALAINFELSCISADTSALHSCFIPETFKVFAKGRDTGFGELGFISRHVIFGQRKPLYLPQDILTLRCRIWKDVEGASEFGQSFGRTHLAIERIFSIETIKLEKSQFKIFPIKSQLQNEVLMSLNALFHEHSLDIETNLFHTKHMKTTTLKLSLVDKIKKTKLCELNSIWLDGPHKEVFRLLFSNKIQYTDDISKGCDFEFIIELVYSTGEETQVIENDCPFRISTILSNYIISYIPSGKLTDGPSILKDLWNLYDGQVFWDVTLKTQNRIFYAHKTVLCARSPVFLAMLTGDTKENIRKCIEVEDISDYILEKFVTFLYSDVFEELEWDTVIELYYAADKYQVERLKLLCCSHFLKNIDATNVCELLMLADRHHDCELRRKVDDFIWENDEMVFSSFTWMKFAYEQQHIAMKTMLSKYEGKENQTPVETYDDKIARCSEFSDDLRNLYESRIANDIVIKTTFTAFPSHKTVLYASSSNFKEIFTNEFTDKSIDFFEVKDLEDDIVSRMLLFLYTDSLDDIHWALAMKLYHVANVYQIQRLKFKTSCFLLENLTVSNASDLLLLAHEHHDVKLKSTVEDFICLHDEEIFGSEEWVKFSRINFLLANETMCARYRKSVDVGAFNS